MNQRVEGSEMSSALRGLASGASIALCLLQPSSPAAATSGASHVPDALRASLTSSSSSNDTRPMGYYSVGRGLVHVELTSTTTSTDASKSGQQAPERNLAVELRAVSGLGVAPLARIVGV